MADVISVSITGGLSASFTQAFTAAKSITAGFSNEIDSLKRTVGQIGNYRSLEKQVSDLADEQSRAAKKTALLREEISKSEKPTKAQTKALRDAEKEELKLSRAIDLKKQALDDSLSSLRRAGIETKNLSEHEAKLNRQLERQQNRQRGIDRFKSLTGFGGEQKEATVGESFGKLKDRSLSAFRDIAVASTVVGGALFGVAKKTADYGDEIAETASYLNISTDALQEYHGVAKMVGVETQAMDKALNKFNTALGNADSKEDVQKFREMGLNLSELKKLGADKAMLKVADAISRMQDPLKQTTVASELFGAKNTKMLNILRQGSAGLLKERENIRKTGMVLSPAEIAMAGKFDDEFNRVTMTLKGAGMILGKQLIPTFSTLFSKLSDWAMKNAPTIERISKKIAVGLEQFAQHLPAIGAGIVKFSSAIFKAADATQRLLGGWDNLAIAIVGIRLIPVATAMWGLASSIGGVASSLFLAVTGTTSLSAGIGVVSSAIFAIPGVGWIAAGLVAGGILIMKYWEPIKAFFSGFWEGFSEGMKPVFDDLKMMWEWITKITKPIRDWLFTPSKDDGGNFAGERSAGKSVGKFIGTMFGGGGVVPRQRNIANEDLRNRFGEANPFNLPTKPSVNKTESNQYNFNIDGSKNPEETAKIVKMELEKRDREKARDKQLSYGSSRGF